MPAFPGGLHSGTVVPLDLRNVDTDAIIPQAHCRTTRRIDFGPFLFRRWRDEEPGFPLDRPEHAGASVLLARENFGCGSSREHAAWAVRDAGFRAVLAPSFGDIFRQNCALNGVAAVVLPAREVQALFDHCAAGRLAVTVDVLHGRIAPFGFTFPLTQREKLLLTRDMDWIGATLAHRERIAAFESARLARQPWLDHRLPES